MGCFNSKAGSDEVWHASLFYILLVYFKYYRREVILKPEIGKYDSGCTLGMILLVKVHI